MGRTRTTNKAIKIPRLHRKGKTWYHVTSTTPRRWAKLSTDYHEALRQWTVLEEGTQQLPGTVAKLIAEYRTHYLPTLGGRTQRDYRAYLEVLEAAFGKGRPHQVKPSHIARYLDTHPHPVIANRQIACFSGVFTFGIRWGRCETNPCKGVKRNKERARDRYIEDEELNAQIEAAPAQISLMIQFAYLTALDLGDILPLRNEDIRNDVLYTARGKTKERVTVRVTPALREILDAAATLPPKSTFIFPNRKGGVYTASGFKSNWQRFKRQRGFNWTFKDIRAKALTDVKNARGRDAAQALAAHASGNTTEVYIRARERVIVEPVR